MSTQRFGEWRVDDHDGDLGPELFNDICGDIIVTGSKAWHLRTRNKGAHVPLDAIKALIAAHEAWLAKQEGKAP